MALTQLSAILRLGCVALVLAACQEPAPAPAPTQTPARGSSTAVTSKAAASGAPASAAPSSTCPSPFGADGITFFDNNPVPSQQSYPERYLYKIRAVAGACPVTHVDIAVNGPGHIGGVRARVETRSATKLDLLAEPAAGDAAGAGAWRPDVKGGELLGSVVLRNGRAFALRLPKLSGPNRGLPVYHPELDLILDP